MEKIIVSLEVAKKLHELEIKVPSFLAYDINGKCCEAINPDAVYNAPSLSEMQDYANLEGVTGVERFGDRFVGVYNGMRSNVRCKTRQDAYAHAIVTYHEVEAMRDKFFSELSKGVEIFGWTVLPSDNNYKEFYLHNCSGVCYYVVEYVASKHSYKILHEQSGDLLQTGYAETVKDGVIKFLKDYIFLVPISESLDNLDFNSLSYEDFMSGCSVSERNLNIDAINLGITSFLASHKNQKYLNFYSQYSYCIVKTYDNPKYSLDVAINFYKKSYPVGTDVRHVCSAYSITDIINRLKPFSDIGYSWSVDNLSVLEGSNYMMNENLEYVAQAYFKNSKIYSASGKFTNPADAYLSIYVALVSYKSKLKFVKLWK